MLNSEKLKTKLSTVNPKTTKAKQRTYNETELDGDSFVRKSLVQRSPTTPVGLSRSSVDTVLVPSGDGLTTRESVRSERRERSNSESSDNAVFSGKGTQNQVSSTLDEIKEEREVLKAFLFNDNNKVNKIAIKFILSKWAVLESKLQSEIIVRKKLAAVVREMEYKKKYTYAQTARMSATAPATGEFVGTTERRPRKEKKEDYEVILIKPEKIEDKRTNDEIKTQVTKLLKDKRNKLKVRNIKQLRNKGIVMEVNSQADVDIINRSNLENVGLVITAPKKLDPSIVIYDVEKDYSRDESKEEFIEKNLPWSTTQEKCDLKQVVNFKYSFKSKNDRMVNWVVQLPGFCFQDN